MISTLDTLEVVKELRAAGFTDDQAEAVTRVVRRTQDIDLSDLATKSDLANFATKADLAELKADLIKWVVGIAFAQIATIVAILKLFPAGHP